MVLDYADQLFGVGPLISSLNTANLPSQLPDVPRSNRPGTPGYIPPPLSGAQGHVDGYYPGISPTPSTISAASLVNWFFLIVGLVIIGIAYDRNGQAGAMLVIILLLGLMLTAKTRGLI